VDEPQVDRPAVLAERLSPGTRIVGSGASPYAAELAGHVLDDTAPYPSTAAVARLAVDDAWWMPVQPLYLRRPDARPPGAPKRVTPA